MSSTHNNVWRGDVQRESFKSGVFVIAFVVVLCALWLVGRLSVNYMILAAVGCAIFVELLPRAAAETALGQRIAEYEYISVLGLATGLWQLQWQRQDSQ